jgi:hypothetical protein
MRFADLERLLVLLLGRVKGASTQILDVDGALVPQAGVVDCHVSHVVDWRPIAALGDPQPMD